MASPTEQIPAAISQAQNVAVDIDPELQPASATPPPHPSPESCRSRFLGLPIEVRLEIYTNGSAFALLQLSHTCSQLRAEIHNHPNLIRSTYGYGTPEGLVPQEGNTTHSSPAFGICFIESLRDRSERKLFERIYLPLQGIHDIRAYEGNRKTVHVCPICLKIKPCLKYFTIARSKIDPEKRRFRTTGCRRCRVQRAAARYRELLMQRRARHEAMADALAAQMLASDTVQGE